MTSPTIRRATVVASFDRTPSTGRDVKVEPFRVVVNREGAAIGSGYTDLLGHRGGGAADAALATPM
jgi:hypothetical protein